MASSSSSSQPSTRNLILELKNDNTQCIVRSINVQTLKVKTTNIPCYFSNRTQREGFLQKLESAFDLKKVKAIGFIAFEDIFEQLSVEFEYRHKCRDFCQKHGIFMLFIQTSRTIALAALIKTSTMVAEGEKVLIVLVNGITGKLSGMTLTREKDRYRLNDIKTSEYPVLSKEWKEDFMENFNPKKTVFLLDSSLKNDKNRLKAITAFFKPSGHAEYSEDFLDRAFVDNILHLMGEKICLYYVVYETNCKFNVLVGNQAHIHCSGVIPCEHSNMANVDPIKSVSLFMDFLPYKPKELALEVKLSNFKDAKIVFFTLKLDINSFYELNVQPLNENMLAYLNISPNTKINIIEKARIVFGKDFYSVFFVGNSKVTVETDSDHLEKTPLYIGFHEQKPVIGRKAKEAFETKPNYVVFDLIKLASTENAEIMSPKWGFRVSKEDGCLMITLQTVDGEKSCSIEFLLAILLKDGLKRIFKTCSEKVEDMQVNFDGITPNEIFKKNIIKAGKLLNVDVNFV